MILFPLSVNSVSAHPHSGQILIDGHTHEAQTEIMRPQGLRGF